MNDDKTGEPSTEIIGFKEEIINIQTAIADFESGQKLNIAIIGEPFTGKTALVNEIHNINPQRTIKLSFSSAIKNKDEITIPEPSKRIMIIDHCEFLYMRKIGGFDILEEFLKLAVTSNNLFITTWNLYSWNYLDEVINIGKFFPVQINLRKFTSNEIKEYLLSSYKPDEIKFIEDVEFEKEKVVNFMKYPVIIKPLKKSVSIPYIKINYHLLKAKLSRKEEKIAIEDIIFEKIHHVSGGNPGAAKVFWQKSLEYPAIKPSKIKEFSFKIELDYNESFILNIIVSMKSIKKDELTEIGGPDFQIDKTIFRLSKQGLITTEEGPCTIRPEALKSVVDFLKKSRLVW
jgi:hypothetical protein